MDGFHHTVLVLAESNSLRIPGNKQDWPKPKPFLLAVFPNRNETEKISVTAAIFLLHPLLGKTAGREGGHRGFFLRGYIRTVRDSGVGNSRCVIHWHIVGILVAICTAAALHFGGNPGGNRSLLIMATNGRLLLPDTRGPFVRFKHLMHEWTTTSGGLGRRALMRLVQQQDSTALPAGQWNVYMHVTLKADHEKT
ncbi:unnamed protein product [Notodromas monacha]|uniref:Uncharacterized protein n=1 Tax=Notodromas monacha TaxID=399045 RepID=A0A7R9GBH4_9CRUS|nr:unnamed protein product [Notodromas monacha]CAG0915068.1 unnamed protein product [Notodromas monacha]